MTELELKAKLFQKLLEVKRRVTYLKKDTKGFNFEYASPELVLGTLNPLLNEVGLFLKTEVLSETHERVFSKYKTQDIYVNGQKTQREIEVFETLFHLNLKFTWVDTETGFEDSALFTASGINNDEQGQGSAQTYGERYFLLKTFNIPTGKDDPDALGITRLEGSPVEAKKPQAPDTAPWITDAQVAGAIKKIEAGEEGILDEVFAKYKVSKANRAKLEAAKPKPIDADPKGDDSTQEKPKATRKPRNSAQKEETAATVKQTPVLDPKAEAIDSQGAIKPNDAFVQELMGERQVKALNWFKAYEGPKWVTVKAYGKLALNGDKGALDKLSKVEDAQSLVTTLSVDDCFKIAAKIKESEVKD